MTDTIKAKVRIVPDPLVASIKAGNPPVKAEMVYDTTKPDKPFPTYLNVGPVIPEPPRLVELTDVDIPNSAMATGAILWWNNETQIFTVERYNPAKLAAYPLDGGEF